MPTGIVSRSRNHPNSHAWHLHKKKSRQAGRATLLQIRRQDDGHIAMRVFPGTPLEHVDGSRFRDSDGAWMTFPVKKFYNVTPEAFGNGKAPGPWLLALSEYLYSDSEQLMPQPSPKASH